MAALVGLLLLVPGAADARLPSERASGSPVQNLLSSCPSAAEIAAIDTDLDLTFDADPTEGTLVCTAAAGSADLTRLEERAYQAIRVIRAMQFERPLPWTSKSLYLWLVDAIDGIRYRDDITFSFCCSPANVVNIRAPNLSVLQTDRWMDPRTGTGMAGLVNLIAHEARHNEGQGHDCSGGNDRTIEQLGAWAIAYYLELWSGLYSGDFLDASSDSGPSYYRDTAMRDSDGVYLTRICTRPSADLSLSGEAQPGTISPGGRFAHVYVARNEGPAAAPQTFLYVDVPSGTRVETASASQGSCIASPAADPVVVGCSLGALAEGGSASVDVEFRVVGVAGHFVLSRGIGAYLTGPVDDPDDSDQAVLVEVRVTPSVCAGRPLGGRVIRGTPGDDRLVGTGKGDLICGFDGNDILIGKGGNDVLVGGSGDDRLKGGNGKDRLKGGAGYDRCRPGSPGYGRGDRAVGCEA